MTRGQALPDGLAHRLANAFTAEHDLNQKKRKNAIITTLMDKKICNGLFRIQLQQ
ncbi:hypothetical protein [Parashewanella tropica]|uniref:hypothetical protein n=1 Tax=Parashewanella tropica TaxID=2547970 RepID=UPI0014792114|nr:hypothetical protein [Parashewanella tropica]